MNEQLLLFWPLFMSQKGGKLHIEFLDWYTESVFDWPGDTMIVLYSMFSVIRAMLSLFSLQRGGRKALSLL